MRVISGRFRGRKLKAVPGKNTRPTTDKTKESIFNMIGPYFDGGRCLDLYSGSGSLGIEAVSRGIEHAVLVDKSTAAIQTINQNIELTKEQDKFTILKSNANRAVQQLAANKEKFDLIFLDPPYAKQTIIQEIEKLAKYGILKPNALIICEVDKDVELISESMFANEIKNVTYGITKIVIYSVDLSENKKGDLNE